MFDFIKIKNCSKSKNTIRRQETLFQNTVSKHFQNNYFISSKQLILKIYKGS